MEERFVEWSDWPPPREPPGSIPVDEMPAVVCQRLVGAIPVNGRTLADRTFQKRKPGGVFRHPYSTRLNNSAGKYTAGPE